MEQRDSTRNFKLLDSFVFLKVVEIKFLERAWQFPNTDIAKVYIQRPHSFRRLGER